MQISINDGLTYVIQKAGHISGIDHLSWKQIGLFALLPLIALVVEALIVGWKNSSLKNLVEHSRSAQGDLWCFALSVFKIFDFIGLLLTFGISYIFVVWLDKQFHADLFLPVQPVYLRVALLFIISDAKNYLRHYCFHRFKWMWELHKYHHSADKFTVLSTLRGHFVETSVGRIFDAIPFIILGATPEEFFLIYMLKDTHQYFLHSQIRSNWGWIGKYILVSPAAHWLHHSSDANHYDRNLGSSFIFWDRIFGTYKRPEYIKQIGLPGSDFNKKGFFFDMMISYRNSLRRIFPAKKNTTVNSDTEVIH